MHKRRMMIGSGTILIAAVRGVHGNVYTVGVGETYSTIQAAVNAAAAVDNPSAPQNVPPSSPVNIMVYGGTYNEAVNIPADPSGNYASANDYWTVQAAPGATVWLDGSFTIGQNRELGTINGINVMQTSGSGWAYNFGTGNTARGWTVENGIIYSDGTNQAGGVYGYLQYGNNYFDHMTVVGAGYGSSGNYASTEVFSNSIFANIQNIALAGSNGVDHSIFFNNGTDLSGATDNGNNMYATNPMFASMDSKNLNFLKLLPGSPAIGAASDSGQYAGFDIGALGGAVINASITWNNSSGSGDGLTWDTSNQNWSYSGTPSTYSDGYNVSLTDTNNGHYSVTLNSTVTPNSVTVNNNSANYTIAGSGSIAGATTSLVKSGSGVLTLANTGVNSYGGGTTVNGGALIIASPGALPANSAVSITAGSLQLGATTGGETLSSLSISGNGSLDITNNHLFINYGSGPDPVSSIAALLSKGYNGGAWNGVGGIATSAPLVVGGLSYGIGYADSADPGNPAGLSSGTLEVKYTLLGDADLNGIVNGLDFGILAANFNKGVTGWDKGDFDYNNIVNGLDFGYLAANFNKGAAGASGVPAYDDPALVAFAAANGLLADVPEPASIGVAAACTIGLLARRKRK